MDTTQFHKGKVILHAGEPVMQVYLLLKGSVRVTFPGGSYPLEKGDVLGICELDSKQHLFTYTALEDVTVIAYPVMGLDSLSMLFYSEKNLGALFTLSAFRQTGSIMMLYNEAEFSCRSLYEYATEDYPIYTKLCEKNELTKRTFLKPQFLKEPPECEPLPGWECSFYDALSDCSDNAHLAAVLQDSSIAMGLIGKAGMDVLHMIELFKPVASYLSSIEMIYLSKDSNDYFDLYCSLYLKLEPNSPDQNTVRDAMERMISKCRTLPGLSTEFIEARIKDFTLKKEALSAIANATRMDEKTAQSWVQYTDSLHTILDYSQIEEKDSLAFQKFLQAYMLLPDPASNSDDVRKLRSALNQLFYQIYRNCFFRSMKEEDIPSPVLLFLTFGYLDEQLVGLDNLNTLIDLLPLTENYDKESPLNLVSPSIYTLYTWLKAIYYGKKDPSRNEFDEDYATYLHKQRLEGSITASEEQTLWNDPVSRVSYEITNMVPQVSRMTFGRISMFSPFLSSTTIDKPLRTSFLTREQIVSSLEAICKVDYSLFYLEKIYTNPEAGINKDYIHTEQLPDIILTPVTGSRGVLWQEIEGKKRITHARMMLPIFFSENLNSTMQHLAGEYRWEMCKRVQGARWNDVSERSLTSEYCDYAQFYKKNHDLSTDAKEKIRLQLQKSKNSYKEMFAKDYMIWIEHESSGSLRLNKVARTILFQYCPFSEDIGASLSMSPIFSDLLERRRIHKAAKLHRMDNLFHKLESMGVEIPDELLDEKEFLQR